MSRVRQERTSSTCALARKRLRQEVTGVDPSQWAEDDGLLTALGAALATPTEDVPLDVLRSAERAYRWRTTEPRLGPALLVYDPPAVNRGQQPHARRLIFASDGLSLELDVGPRTAVGRLLPAETGHVTVEAADGWARSEPVDGSGRFRIPVPRGPVRFRCVTGNAQLVTGWLQASPTSSGTPLRARNGPTWLGRQNPARVVVDVGRRVD